MSSTVTSIALADPGEGHRLSHQACEELRSRLRTAAREAPGCLLIDVEAAAWHQGPEFPPPGLDGGSDVSQAAVAGNFHALIEQLFSFAAPVLVTLDGPVSGFGLALALAADLRFATPRATFSLGSPASAAALLGGTSWLLTRAVGSATFAHLVWTGTALEADAARERGLLSSVSPAAGTEARALAERLAALPAVTTSAIKRALTSRQRPDLAAALDYESWLVGVATSQDG
jgi:2-(1,2-epoxy-1,2-dihydrophenyl)acetyl-CoA isomerase